MNVNYVDPSVAWGRENQMWPPLLIPKEDIDTKIGQLADSNRPGNGRRETLFVHPLASASGLGLTPGTDVTLTVLKPGEKTSPRRQNASQVSICIRGEGLSMAKGKSFPVGEFDVWTTPAMSVHSLENAGKDLFILLTYSNAPTLRQLEVWYVEEEDKLPAGWNNPAARTKPANGQRAKDLMPPIPIGGDGARLLSYEHLVDPDFVESLPLHWPYLEVAKHLETLRKIVQGYLGRRLYLLYNPATEKRNGTTHSLFATIAAYGPNITDKPHRHVSSSINYIMKGYGHSRVGGEKMEWKAGDLHFSAPGWMIHGHASGPEGTEILTVQDHPFHIANDSLVWQEDLKGTALSLGSDVGFQTNIADYLSSNS